MGSFCGNEKDEREVLRNTEARHERLEERDVLLDVAAIKKDNDNELLQRLNEYKAKCEMLNEYKAKCEMLNEYKAKCEMHNKEMKEIRACLLAKTTETTKLIKQSKIDQQTLLNNASNTGHKAHNNKDETISELQTEISNLQQQILEMTGIVDIKQKLPTTEETLLLFQSLRDQQHANAFSEIKKHFKSLNKKYQKYYISQCIYKILFELLIACYDYISQHKKDIFDKIAVQLNMQHCIEESSKMHDDDDGKQDTNGQHLDDVRIRKEINRILSNMFGSYFKHNYNYILKIGSIIQPILDEFLEKYKEKLSNLDDNVIEVLKEYIERCCEICWVMVLQDPTLEFSPKEWNVKDVGGKNDNAFNENIHKRILGSNRKCNEILYCVWPTMSSDGKDLMNYKIDVVTKEDFYTEFKQKKAT